jgi:hypothetical protein
MPLLKRFSAAASAGRFSTWAKPSGSIDSINAAASKTNTVFANILI